MSDTRQQAADVQIPDMLRTYLVDRIRSKRFEVPMLPQVATQVLDLCTSDDADAAKLSQLVHQDQALASQVLRIVNTPMFGGQSEIVSLQQAISRLGLQQLMEIVTAVSVQSKVFAEGRNKEILTKLWKHSLATGFVCKEVARIRKRNVESMFLCGLLHDIGKPVVLTAVTEFERETGGEVPEAHVLLAMNEYHKLVGEHVGRAWSLPDQVVESIRYHHDYDLAPSFSESAMTVSFANQSAHVMFPTTKELTREELEADQVLVDLNLYQDDLGRVLDLKDKLEEKLEAVR